MKKEIKDLKNGRKEVQVELSSEELMSFEGEVLEALAEELELPGFRKGKVPREVIRKKIGDEKLLLETAKRAIEETYKKLVEEENLEPISRPEVEIKKLARGNPFEFKATFTVLPEVELPDYEKIAKSVEKKEEKVKEEEVEETLNWLQKARPRLKKVLRKAKKGDFLEIEFFSPELQGGKKFEDAFILGKGSLIPGFEEELLGAETGEERKFTIKLPDDFKIKEAAGKDARFNVKVKSVKEREEREINDEFAKEIGDFNDLEDLKENIRKGLREEKDLAGKKKRREKILSKIVAKTDLEIPQLLIERERERRIKDLKRRAENELGLSFEEYLEKIEKSEKELRKTLEKEAESRAKRFLVLRKIAEKEGVEVTDSEVKKEVEKVLSNYPDPEKAKEIIDPSELRSYTMERLRNEKTLEVLENF